LAGEVIGHFVVTPVKGMLEFLASSLSARGEGKGFARRAVSELTNLLVL